jgi:hypothetical protein
MFKRIAQWFRNRRRIPERAWLEAKLNQHRAQYGEPPIMLSDAMDGLAYRASYERTRDG